jgi:acyl-CoA thioester hydrolase
MSKLHLILTEVARHRVRFADCDPMRIMYYGSYIRLFEIGWTELFRQRGQPLSLFTQRGLYLAVIEATCHYVKPARYDDELIIRAALTEIGVARFRIHYEVARSDGDLLVTGTTVHAVLNEAGRPQRIPVELREAAHAAQQ